MKSCCWPLWSSLLFARLVCSFGLLFCFTHPPIPSSVSPVLTVGAYTRLLPVFPLFIPPTRLLSLGLDGLTSHGLYMPISPSSSLFLRVFRLVLTVAISYIPTLVLFLSLTFIAEAVSGHGDIKSLSSSLAAYPRLMLGALLLTRW